jgi:5-hydroxyisourate hydrolase-like protein (transthyretin family)
MKKIILSLATSLLISSSWAQLNIPYVLINLEFILDNQQVDYEQVVELDPSFQPPDTISVVALKRSFAGYFTQGLEIVYPTKDTAQWVVNQFNNRTEVSVLNVFNANDTVSKDIFWRGSNNLDSSITSQLNMGSGLTNSQETILYRTGKFIDSLEIFDFSNGPRQLLVRIYRYYDANINKADSLRIFALVNNNLLPVQSVDYKYNHAGVLDSILLFDLFSSATQPVEIVTTQTNANGEITRATFNEENPNNGEFDPYLVYTFKERVDVGLAENPLEKISFSPNPVQSQITHNSPIPLQIKITDSQGRAVYSAENSSSAQVINLENLSSGVYNVQFSTGNYQKTQKISKL